MYGKKKNGLQTMMSDVVHGTPPVGNRLVYHCVKPRRVVQINLKFPKFFNIFCHIKFLNAYIEY